jgi:pilus assembly protein CpaE
VPDLANLRNAKNIIDLLKQSRTNDGPPRLVINMAKTPKRPEIPVKEFSTALDLSPAQIIEFDSETFGLAANNGQMIEEYSSKAKAAQQFRELALALAHRREPKEEKKASALAPLLEKFKLKR